MVIAFLINGGTLNYFLKMLTLSLFTVVAFNNCAKMEFLNLNSTAETNLNTQAQSTELIHFKVLSASVRAVDLLFVIDNSASMADELIALGSRFSDFSQALAGLDWQICLTTTDADEQAGRLIEWKSGLKILKPTTGHAADLFKNKLNSFAETPSGSGFEQPIKSVNKAFLMANSENSDCFRPGINKSVLIITDEDELSDGWIIRADEPVSGLTPTALNFPNSLITTVKNQFPWNAINVNAIAIKENDTVCLDEQRRKNGIYDFRSGYPAVRVSEAALISQGTVQSICERDYSTSMMSIGNSIRESLFSTELNCAESEAKIISINYLNSMHSDRRYEIAGTRLNFYPALTASEQAEVQFSCH